MKYSNYLEQYIGQKGKLHVHTNNGIYEFEVSDKLSLFDTKYMIASVGEDFVVLSKGQNNIEEDSSRYDQMVISLQRFLFFLPKKS